MIGERSVNPRLNHCSFNLSGLKSIVRILAQSGEAVLHDSHWAWIRDPFLNHTGGWDPEGKQVVIHGHTPVIARIAPLSEIMKAADLVEQHRRICLDAGAAVVPQIAWLELDQGTYRYAVTRSA